MQKSNKILVGTSGWHYDHWMDTFYPADVKKEDQLAYYRRFFDTVEINNSFYNLPLAKTFTHWHDVVGEGFEFAVKGSRYISHMKKLNVDKATIIKFLGRVSKLKSAVGPILFQLPPRWNVNVERLGEFLKKLPKTYRYVFEFRNNTWLIDEVYELMAAGNVGFCIYDLAGYQTTDVVTADFVYIRLHGPGDKYQGSYTTAALKKWAKKIDDWHAAGKDVYCYFDNDQAAYAVANAQTLKTLIAKLLQEK